MGHGLGKDGWPSDETVIHSRDWEIEKLRNELASRDLVIQQMREALESCIEFEKAGGFIYDIAKQALSLQTSTEALDAYVKKAVEEERHEY